MKRQKVLLLNLSGIGCRSTSKIDLQASMTIDQDFPGKSNSLQKRFLFLISIAQWNVEEKDTTMSIVADGKGQNRGKNRKSCKMWWGARQPIDRQLFKLRFAAIVGWYLHNEKEISFQHDVWQSLVWRRLLCSKSASAWSSASISRFLKGIFFFFSWQSGTFLSSLGQFFYQWLPSAFDFSMSKNLSISKELPRVSL